jgi:hypothetical protein
MVVFENAGHGVYDEAPDEFFRVLKEFIKDLPKIDAAGLARYQEFLAGWVREVKARPDIVVESFGWGMASSRELAGKYAPKWIEALGSTRYAMRVGFALYDVERYGSPLRGGPENEGFRPDLAGPDARSSRPPGRSRESIPPGGRNEPLRRLGARPIRNEVSLEPVRRRASQNALQED